MAKKTAKTKRIPTARKAAAPKAEPQGRLVETWNATIQALTSAEAEIEKQIKLLLKRNKLNPKDAKAALEDIGSRIDKERKKALKQLESRLSSLQSRVKKERKAAVKMADEAVKGALVALNIPSRQEIAELTRKVDELSKKIDGFQR
jgi:polyhydroxyalkanoate synthesis regulator phasin